MSNENRGSRYGAGPVRAQVCEMRGCDRRATQLLAEYAGDVVHACDSCADYLTSRLDIDEPVQSWRDVIRDPRLVGLGCVCLALALWFSCITPSDEYSWIAFFAVMFGVPGIILVGLGLVFNDDEANR